MSKERLNAFSDGVIAIIITIMVLELKVPHGADWAALGKLVPVFSSYVLSFIYVAIYWNNHHHMMHACERVDGPILWANMHLLFWLSLIPFATGWMGENHFAPLPTALYGVSLLMPALAYYVLQKAIVRLHGNGGILAQAIGDNFKAKLSPALYVAATALAFLSPWISCAIYAAVAAMWVIPDRRIETLVARSDETHDKNA
ncbi:MAG: TMEM175 family protein [Reyranellaceae bacterium]